MKIAFVGTGFTGLAAAWDLRNSGNEVTIFEAADTVGGLAGGFKELCRYHTGLGLDFSHPTATAGGYLAESSRWGNQYQYRRSISVGFVQRCGIL